MKNEMTDKRYWEHYYKNASTNKKDIEHIGQADDKYWDVFYRAAKLKSNNILEIGTYPGRYLAYLSAKYNLQPTGIDYNSDRSKIEETMQIMGISDYDYIQKDFFKVVPAEKFDFVFSMGFVEHFDNFDEVMDRHIEFLNDGGALLIRVPNKRFFRKWYGMLVDSKNLRIHNLKCMKVKVFKHFAQRNNLVIHMLKYDGGFAYPVHQHLNFPQKVVYHLVRRISIILNPLIRKYPSKLYSNYLLAIFTKK